jgi:hypothetical protein
VHGAEMEKWLNRETSKITEAAEGFPAASMS